MFMTEKLIYLDFETEGVEPEKDKENNRLLTVQWQEIEAETGGVLEEDLKIYKLWDYKKADGQYDEKKFIEDVLRKSVVDNRGRRIMFLHSKWPPALGYNLFFEQYFMDQRIAANNIVCDEILITGYKVPAVDLKYAGVLINGGKFAGSALHDISNKMTSGESVLKWWKEGDTDSIINYVEDETKSFIDFYKKLLEHTQNFKI